ncbi:hypothetical protein ACLB2K_064853 [Fragaria x ananassa]
MLESGSGTWRQKDKGFTIFDSKNKKMVLGRRNENNESDQDRRWIMHEFSLPPSRTSKLPHEYVLCRIRVKADKMRKLVAKKVSQNHVDNEAIDHERELDELNDINLEDNDASNTSSDHVNNASESVLTSLPLPSYHPKEITDHDNVQDYPLYDDYVFRLMLIMLVILMDCSSSLSQHRLRY